MNHRTLTAELEGRGWEMIGSSYFESFYLQNAAGVTVRISNHEDSGYKGQSADIKCLAEYGNFGVKEKCAWAETHWFKADNTAAADFIEWLASGTPAKRRPQPQH